MCRPQKCGGLGIKNLELFNVALFTKWKWRCVNDLEAIWSNLLKARYDDRERWCAPLECLNLSRTRSLWWRDLRSLSDN